MIIICCLNYFWTRVQLLGAPAVICANRFAVASALPPPARRPASRCQARSGLCSSARSADAARCVAGEMETEAREAGGEGTLNILA